MMERPHRCFYLSMTIYCACLTYAEAFYGFNRPCKDTTPECLRKSLQAVFPEFVKGFPEFGITALDPLVVKNERFELPGGLTVIIDEGNIRGLRDCTMDSVSKHGKYEYEVQFRCDLILHGKYRSSGKLLIIPFDAEGISTITCKNVISRITVRFNPTKALGQTFLTLKDFSLIYNFGNRVSIDLPDLFEGNPGLRNLALNIIKQNKQEMVNMYGGPIAKYGSITILKNLQKLLYNVPMNELEVV